MSELTGIAIQVDDVEKFVGKVGRLANGRRVFYREANFSDFYSFTTDAISVDCEAANYAFNELQADVMVCYCKDTHEAYVASADDVKASFVLNLGELPQYRVMLAQLKHYPDFHPINLGFTTNVVHVNNDAKGRKQPTTKETIMATPEHGIDFDDGFDITDEVDVGDLSTQQGNDVIDPAKKVRLEIRKVSVRPYQMKGEDGWRKKFLALDLVIVDGVDDEGKYKGKHLFQDLLLVANTADYPDLDTENYRTKARFDTKMFLKAMGFDPAKPPKVNDDFLTDLTGREVFGDIQRREIRAQSDGKWAGTGEFKNEVRNFRNVDAE